MMTTRFRLLSTAAVLPLVMGVVVGFGATTGVLTGGADVATAACSACNPCKAKKKCGACNPCAAKKKCGACNPCAAKKASGGCNPCAAKKACNPCAAKKACGACNPCAAKKACGACGAKSACGACGACNPCGAGGGAATDCVVPRVKGAAKCNPCAAKKACGACNPCKAKKACGACNPCAAKKAGGACNPCAAKKACGACNPCAAKKACGACNPCKAKAACGACGACSPCGAASSAKVTNAEAASVYKCVLKELKAAYAKSGLKISRVYWKYAKFNTVPYVSDTHGARYVNNYASKAARRTYRKWDKVRKMPRGSILAKDSFTVNKAGHAVMGPLFLMEKKRKGWNKATADWRYTMVMPDGAVFGVTKGKGSAKMTFCHDCHTAAEENDAMFFLPEEFRVK